MKMERESGYPSSDVGINSHQNNRKCEQTEEPYWNPQLYN